MTKEIKRNFIHYTCRDHTCCHKNIIRIIKSGSWFVDSLQRPIPMRNIAESLKLLDVEYVATIHYENVGRNTITDNSPTIIRLSFPGLHFDSQESDCLLYFPSNM